jgi:hypothetical protein
MSAMSDDDVVEELVIFFANCLDVLAGKQASQFEDCLVDHYVRLAQRYPNCLRELIASAVSPQNGAAHRAVMFLFQSKLVFAAELQSYVAEHGSRRRKSGPRHDWAFDNCILSAVSWTIKMRLDLAATRNPSRVLTSHPDDYEDEEAIKSASALVARALRTLRQRLLGEQPADLVAVFGRLTKKQLDAIKLAEGTIQRRWAARPW